MEDFAVVNVLDGEAILRVPVQNPVFGKGFHRLLDPLRKVPTVGVVHDNAELAFFGFVDLLEEDDVGVVGDHFHDFGLFEGVLLLLRVHRLYVDLLDDRVGAVAFTLNEKSLSKGTFS